jgi:hypothetical protein
MTKNLKISLVRPVNGSARYLTYIPASIYLFRGLPSCNFLIELGPEELATIYCTIWHYNRHA